MTYRVEVSERVLRDLEVLYLEKHVSESSSARWFNGLNEALDSLATFPHRCPIAPEPVADMPELRHLMYGKKPHVYASSMK